MKLAIDRVRVELDGCVVLAEATLLVEPGTVAGLVGPNGSGKSSLLRTIYRHTAPAGGSILVDERDVWGMRPSHAAQKIAAIPQETRADFDITVRDMVAIGRTPHKAPFARADSADRAAIDEAMRRVAIEHLAHRRYATLSGGERQRALLAKALAQATPILVLDEPTNHLDIRHQLQLLTLVRELELTTIVALHDLNLAASFCDQVHVLRGGELVASGPPADVLTPTLLREVFTVDADILPHPRTGAPHVVFSPLASPLPA